MWINDTLGFLTSPYTTHSKNCMGLQAYAGSGWNIHSQTFEFCRGNSLAKKHQFAPLQWWKSLSVPKIIKDIVTCYSLRTGCMLILTHCLHGGCSLCFTLLTVLLLPDKLSIHLMCLIFCASVLGKQSSFAPHLPSNFSQNQHAEVCCQLKHRCQVDEL